MCEIHPKFVFFEALYVLIQYELYVVLTSKKNYVVYAGKVVSGSKKSKKLQINWIFYQYNFFYINICTSWMGVYFKFIVHFASNCQLQLCRSLVPIVTVLLRSYFSTSTLGTEFMKINIKTTVTMTPKTALQTRACSRRHVMYSTRYIYFLTKATR